MTRDSAPPATQSPDPRRARGELVAYFALTFAITWGLGAMILLFRPQLEGLIGPIGPLNHSWLYFVAVYAPTISAVTLSLAFGGLAGLKRLALGLVRPVRLAWIGLAIFTYPACLLAWGLAERLLGHGAPPVVDLRALLIGAPLLLLTTTAAFTDPGAFGEETGWRGFALPRLLQLCKPASAGLILGIIWALWHIPAFFAQGLSQSGFNFAPFFVGVVSMAVFMTWIYVHAGGNFVVAGVIPHLILNLVYDAHVLAGGPGHAPLGDAAQRIEAIILTVIALSLVAAFGPGLRGWRRRAPGPPVQSR